MKRLGTIALTAALLWFGGTYGLQAQQKHGHKNDKDDHQVQQLTKKEQKELQKQIRANEVRSRQLTKQEQKAVNASIRQQEEARARYRAEQLRAANAANLARQRELARERALTASTYRYRIASTNRATSRLGAQLLQRAVSDGYAQGYQSGRTDLNARQSFDYYDENGYRVGTYGFTTGYIPASDYQYYFRQGFQRGYQDGFYQSNQFGSPGSTGKATILAAVLATILGFTVR